MAKTKRLICEKETLVAKKQKQKTQLILLSSREM